jgi:DNA-binding response OmpR family regulator
MSKLALVVEDNEDLSDICSIALQEAGFETHVAFTGDSALAWLSDAKPDLVVLDINLPGVNGVDVLKNIRADDRLKDTKIIITTADPYYVNELGVQADLVLVKPVLFAQLLNVFKGLEW